MGCFADEQKPRGAQFPRSQSAHGKQPAWAYVVDTAELSVRRELDFGRETLVIEFHEFGSPLWPFHPDEAGA